MRTRFVTAALAALLAACSGGSSTPGPEIRATWMLAPATSCGSVSGANVEITATLAGTTSAYQASFPCTAGVGLLPLPATGTYVVVVQLLDGTGAAVEESMQQTVNVVGLVDVTAALQMIP
jgi:hypothetical protein